MSLTSGWQNKWLAFLSHLHDPMMCRNEECVVLPFLGQGLFREGTQYRTGA